MSEIICPECGINVNEHYPMQEGHGWGCKYSRGVAIIKAYEKLQSENKCIRELNIKDTNAVLYKIAAVQKERDLLAKMLKETGRALQQLLLYTDDPRIPRFVYADAENALSAIAALDEKCK
jgi:hypothetical protein